MWVVVGILISIHTALTVFHYEYAELPWLVRQIFDVDEEDSIPTWYSASALLFTAFVLWLLAHGLRISNHPRRGYWYGLSFGFGLLSLDEIAGLHETFNSVTEISWAVPGGVLALLVGMIYARFLFTLPGRIAVVMAVGGAVFIGGAVGVELLTEPFLYNDALDTLQYNIWTAVEEGMEMAGVLLFLGAVLKHMEALAQSSSIDVEIS